MARRTYARIHPSGPGSTPLFEPMMKRYLASPVVRDWLFDPNSKLIHHSNIPGSFSYACMYYPPSSIPVGPGPYPLPKPFLDIGDFVVCQRLVDGIALGTLFNKNENHALCAVRDSMLKDSNLSSRPRARNFAIDLRVQYMEIVEFAWMDDYSLIIACRRLHASPDVPEKSVLLSADVLIFPPVAPGDTIDTIFLAPLLRMTLSEDPALCQLCGLEGVGLCRCPPSCKIRAPSRKPSLSSSTAHCNFDEISEKQNPRLAQIAAQTWPDYSKRMFSFNQVGNFFCNWYKRSPCGSILVPLITPRHPIPYQLVSGQKRDTFDLIALYTQRTFLNESAVSYDQRLTISFPSPTAVQDEHLQLSSYEGGADRLINYGAPSSSHTLVDLLEPNTSVGSLPQLSSTSMLLPGNSSASEKDQMSLKNQLDEELNNNNNNKNRSTAISMTKSHAPKNEDDDDDTKPVRRIVKYHDVSLLNKKERLNHFMGQYVVDNRCIQCEKTFSKRSNLVRHIDTKHFGLRPFQCDKCSKRFGHRNHLRRHVAKLHARSVCTGVDIVQF